MSNIQVKNGNDRSDMGIKASDIIVYTPEGEKVNVELKARKTLAADMNKVVEIPHHLASYNDSIRTGKTKPRLPSAIRKKFESMDIEELIQILADDDVNPVEYGECLAYVRVNFMGLTQSEFANKFVPKKSRIYIANIENGTVPSRGFKLEIIQLLNKELDLISKVQMIHPIQEWHTPFSQDPPFYTENGIEMENLCYYTLTEDDYESELAFIGDEIIFCSSDKNGTGNDIFLMQNTEENFYFIGKFIMGVDADNKPYITATMFIRWKDIVKSNLNFDKPEVPTDYTKVKVLGKVVSVRKKLRTSPY